MTTQNPIKYICEKCEKTFVREGNLLNHTSKCNGIKTITVSEEWFNPETNKYKCPYCELEYSKKGISSHIWRNHGDGKDFTANNDGYKNGRVNARKGLTKENDKATLIASEKLKAKYASGELIGSAVGRIISLETKEKISKSRIAFLKANPNMVPYLLNHKSKGESYPEKYFREILEQEKIDFIQEKQESVYSLDFVIGTIDLEIDGEQHYVDSRIVESDKRRTIYLENMGYTIIRVRWSEYQKLNRMERKQFIKNLLGRLK